MNEGTIVLPCTCKDEEQDKLYGKGMRLHNRSCLPKRKEAFCTVCSPSNRKLRMESYPVNAAKRKPKIYKD